MPSTNRPKLFPRVESYVEQRIAEFDKIPMERKAQLEKVARYVASRIEAGEPARLTFICTHNSRRSHLSQIWGAIAAAYFGNANVETYSGGTEATAFNPRAVAAIERAGLQVEQAEAEMNPRYAVRFHETTNPLVCFSKVYHEAPNPRKDYCAVMTCSHADENCPNVMGCALRVAIPYEDPKAADGTDEEAARYDDRCRQIAREMLYLFSRVGRS
ncbi:MAG: protein-tyrosine-phosphatase [Planctomycetaceae bacterium]|nr:MAG: protein-tyrosine-phosphatase [Planctomycetaceae bacterium]